MLSFLLTAKQEDDELVLQIVYVFHQLVLHESTREKTIGDSRILAQCRRILEHIIMMICITCIASVDVFLVPVHRIAY